MSCRNQWIKKEMVKFSVTTIAGAKDFETCAQLVG
jgi:hypothetical protein